MKIPVKNILTLASAVLLGYFLYDALKGRHEHPPSYELPEFVFLEQPDQITCGPTSAAMLLRSYGIDVSLEDVKEKSKTEWFKYDGESIGMTSPEYIPIALKSHGLPARKTRGSVQKVKSLVIQGRPPIVLLRSGTKTWHYVVVIGYTETTIIVADPGHGQRRTMATEAFVGSWDFTTDMTGESVEAPCKVCKGTGKWTKGDFGPLSSCEICSGTGVATDVLVELLRMAEVYPKTMIVPSKSIHTINK